MSTGSCPPREELLGCARGNLPDDRAEQVLLHAEDCPACQSLLDGLPCDSRRHCQVAIREGSYASVEREIGEPASP